MKILFGRIGICRLWAACRKKIWEIDAELQKKIIFVHKEKSDEKSCFGYGRAAFR